MKVAELVEKLNTYTTDSLVITEGYDSIKSVSEINVIEAQKKEWYLSEYEKPFPEIENGIKAVFIYTATKKENK